MKVYFSQNLLLNEYISFLVPLLWCPDFNNKPKDKARYRWENQQQIRDRYNHGNNILIEASQKNCDYFVYPKYFILDCFDELKKYSDEAKLYNKKVLVFSYREIDDYIDINDNIIWYKRATEIDNPENEICLPPFPEDLLKYHEGKIKFISKENKLHRYSIWFTGYSDYHNIKSFLHYCMVRVVGLLCRTKVCKYILMQFRNDWLYSILVNAWIWNFCRWKTLRQVKRLIQYKFNRIQRKKILTSNVQGDMRKEYIENLNNSDFGLIIRWFANYSSRLYEVMSLWKIPIYIDTGAKLPFQNEIPYHKLFVIVPFKQIHNIWHYIDKFIEKNKWDLTEIQKEIRDTYEKYFIMKNYYTRIIKDLTIN